MRVTHRPTAGVALGGPEARRSFDAALARVRSDREPRHREELRATRRRDAAGPSRGEGPSADGDSANRAAAGSPTAASAPTTAAAPAGHHRAEPALPELREAARAIPPAIWAGRLQGDAVVELTFGRELSVELRQGAAGIEIAVRTDAALARAARADLPALVRSLRERGVEVARAEVRAGSHLVASALEAEARDVDARAPLR